MSTFLITFSFFALVVLAMAVGVIFSGKRITGSCGGLNGLVENDEGDMVCGVCGLTYEEAKKDCDEMAKETLLDREKKLLAQRKKELGID